MPQARDWAHTLLPEELERGLIMELGLGTSHATPLASFLPGLVLSTIVPVRRHSFTRKCLFLLGHEALGSCHHCLVERDEVEDDVAGREA